MIKQVHNITFGYSDSEDRIWVRLILQEGGEARLWLTRRLCIALCRGIIQLIEKYTFKEGRTLIGDELNVHLRNEFYETSRSTWDPTPPPPAQKKQSPESNNYSTALCHQVSIDGGSQWALRFSATQNLDYQLALDRKLTQKILVALLKQSQAIAWDIQLPNTWLNVS